MSNSYRIAFLVIAAALLILHFTNVFCYAFKNNGLSQIYMYPYFHQNARLFTPPPAENYELYAFYTIEGKKYSENVFNDILTGHQRNRFAGYENLLLALSNSIHFFEKNTTPDQFQPDADKNFKMLQHFVKYYIKHTAHGNPENLRLALIVNSSDSTARKVYFN